MKRLIHYMLICFPLTMYAQDPVTLTECHQLAIELHPIGLQKSDLERINELKLNSIWSTYLPQFNINGKATYQSDVVEVDPGVPGVDFPFPPHDQYGVNLDVNQVLYNGGTTRKRKELQEITNKTEVQQVEVDLYQVKEQVNNVYFLILILNENLNVLHLNGEILKEKLESVRSGVENGILLKSDQYLLEAEVIKLDQKIAELNISINSALEVMKILTGRQLNSAQLILPEIYTESDTLLNRPEIQLFQYKKEQLLTAGNLKATETMPRLYAFGQFGYGKPGLNIMNTEFDTYYMVGINLSWKLWDWQITNREKQTYKIQSEMIDSKEAAFDQNISIAVTNEKGNLEKLSNQIESDRQLIELQKKILTSVSSQLDNGVITSSEYLEQLNALNQSQINLKTHQIQHIQSQINYQTILGNI